MWREKDGEEEQESRDAGAGPAPLASLRRWLAVQIAPEVLEEAERDPLTGLNNRRADHREVTKVMEARAAVPNCTDRLVRFRADVDNFKALNDTHGHPVGDRALILIGRVLQSSVRMGEDVVSPARVGGDEFAITLVLSPRTAPERVRDRLERNVSNALRREGLHRAGLTDVGVESDLRSPARACRWRPWTPRRMRTPGSENGGPAVRACVLGGRVNDY